MSQTPSNPVTEKNDQWLRYPSLITVLSYLRDHHFAGKTIYPAVEILQGLGATVLNKHPETCVTVMQNAAFDRFMEIGPDDREIEVFHDLKAGENGRMSARLVTVTPSGNAGIKREKIHAVVDFAGLAKSLPEFPYDMAASLEGIGFRIPAQRLYDELVPFGHAFRSLQGELILTENGGIAPVLASTYPALTSPLGSPFPFDGMMHIACAWSQRFHGIIAFPVGFDERRVLVPTVPGETYFCRVIPVSAEKDVLSFDMAIYDRTGNLREFIRGVKMRDVSGGRIKPPQWVRHDGVDPLVTLRAHCRALALVEDAAVSDFADRALTPVEASRYAKMGKRRQRGFLTGRLALKALARKLANDECLTSAEHIHTMMEDRVRPFCPDLTGKTHVFCSLSHDRRFAVAVGSDEEIGVDVEILSERALKARHLYMTEEERTLSDASLLGRLPAALRIWSIKEGVTKAVNMPIGESWKQVHVTDIGLHESRLTVGDQKFWAFHDTVEDHVFTLVKRVS